MGCFLTIQWLWMCRKKANLTREFDLIIDFQIFRSFILSISIILHYWSETYLIRVDYRLLQLVVNTTVNVRMAEQSKALHLLGTLFPLFYAVRASPLPSFTIFYWKLIDPIFQGGLGFKSRPEMPIFQQPSAAMPPMSGGLYGGPEYPQGGGEWRKVAEIGLN